MENEEICQWQANFNLEPPISLDIVQNLPDVKILRGSDNTSALFDKIEVTTPELASYIEAHLHAETICNRCTDYLTLITGIPVKTTLLNITQIGTQGSKKTGCAEFKLDFIVANRPGIDLTGETVERIIRGRDKKLNRQLSHYRRAIVTDDAINKIGALYLVIVDEYGENCQFLGTYRYVRNIISHTKLTKIRKQIEQAKKRFGKAYIDPSAPKDLDELSKDAKALQVKAKEILVRKIQQEED